MRIKHEPTISGWFPLMRVLFKLLNSNLTVTELGYYLLFVSQANFDTRHKHYTAILRDPDYIAKEFALSTSTVSRQRRNLQNKGLIKECKGTFYIRNMELFKTSDVQSLVKSNPDYLKIADLLSKMEDNIAKIVLEEHFFPDL